MIIKNKLRVGIYFLINMSNGKIYVGQTINLNSRANDHLNLLKRNLHCNRHLQSAYNKSGESQFYDYIAEYCEVEKLTEREQYWIDFIGLDRIYNLAPAGGSCLGLKRTPEFCAKMSVLKIGKKRPSHVGVAVALANKTRIISEEGRSLVLAALRKANTGRKLSVEHCKKISDNNVKRLTAFGVTLSRKEWSAKIGVSKTAIAKRLAAGWSVEDAVSRQRRNYTTACEALGGNLGVQFSEAPGRHA